MSVRPAKTQISLGIIRPVSSEFSLSTWTKLGSVATHRAHSEDSDQTGQMPRLNWVFAGHTVTLLVLSCRGSFVVNAMVFQPPSHCDMWKSLFVFFIPDKVFRHFQWYKKFLSYSTLYKTRNPDTVMWLTCRRQAIGPRQAKKYLLWAMLTVTLHGVPILAEPRQANLCLRAFHHDKL